MQRRRVLVTAGSALGGVLAGCVGSPRSDEPATADSDSTPKADSNSTPPPGSNEGQTSTPASGGDDQKRTPGDDIDRPALPGGPKTPPDHPDEIRLDRVSEYVEAFEYAYIYNTLYCPEIETITVDSETVLPRETDHGIYAFGAGAGSSTCGSDEETVVAHHGPEPYPYFVDEATLVRIDTVHDEVRGRDQAYGSDSFDTDAAGLTLTNFDSTAHELAVTVTHESETAYEGVLEVPARSQLNVTSISAVAGEHELTVETENGKTATGTWDVDPEQLYVRVVRVFATGEPDVEQLDPYRALYS